MRVELIGVEGELALEFTPEMREHLALEGDEVEIEFTSQGILLKKKSAGLTFAEAKEQAFSEFHEALTNLAK